MPDEVAVTAWESTAPLATWTITTSNVTSSTGGYYQWPHWTTATNSAALQAYSLRSSVHWGDVAGRITRRAEAVAEETPEQAEARRVRQEERQARWTARRERERAARRRALELLVSFLDEEQRAQLEMHGHFDVVGSMGGHYRISEGTAGNVHALLEGRRVAQLCAHPDLDQVDEEGRVVELPWGDVALGQYLLLTTDEPGFHDVANMHWATEDADAALAHLRETDDDWRGDDPAPEHEEDPRVVPGQDGRGARPGDPPGQGHRVVA